MARKLIHLKPASSNSISIKEFAKRLSETGAEVSPKQVFDWLYKEGFLYGTCDERLNTPAMEDFEKYLEIVEKTYVYDDGHITTYREVMITTEGERYFNKFLSNKKEG